VNQQVLIRYGTFIQRPKDLITSQPLTITYMYAGNRFQSKNEEEAYFHSKIQEKVEDYKNP
jgi:hypothetical protein